MSSILTQVVPHTKLLISQRGFGASLAEQNLPNDPLIEANSSCRDQNSTNWGGKSIFPKFRAYQSHDDQMLSAWET